MLLQQEFKKHLEEKHMTPNTVYSYMNDMARFEAFCVPRGRNDISEATVDDVSAYYFLLAKDGMSQSSVRRHRSSLNAYFSFLVSVGVLDSNPTRGADMPVLHDEKKLDVLTHKEIDALLSYDYGDDEKGLRDRAIVEVLYATGMKVSSLISIKVDDYNPNLKAISCDGRMMPLYKSANESVKTYLDMARPFFAKTDDDALFVNMSGKSLTRQGLWKILCKVSTDVGIEKQLTPRLVRRSLAVHMLENGAAPEDIEKVLDLSSLGSTGTYVKLLHKKKGGEGYLKFHPFAKDKE